MVKYAWIAGVVAIMGCIVILGLELISERERSLASRNRVATAIANAQSLQLLSEDDFSWLRSVAQWSAHDTTFYEAYYAVPPYQELQAWWSRRPGDWDEHVWKSRDKEVSPEARWEESAPDQSPAIRFRGTWLDPDADESYKATLTRMLRGAAARRSR